MFAACLIAATTVTHAALVFLYNSPSNALQAAAAPALRIYSGPTLNQGWMIFAPDIPSENYHVLARARTEAGRVTRWFDITKFFLAEMQRSRLTPTHALSEGLAHAAPFLDAREQSRRATARTVILQTAAMVLNLYIGNEMPAAMQVEIDSREVPDSGSHSTVKDVGSAPWPWVSMPHAQALVL
jgi:hypothetical protein